MNTAPRGARLHIGLFGRRNAGKSSLLNALVRQDVSIVSDVAGTTTDPVEKPMELQPLGPVLFIDTAGLDDVGALGEARVRKTRAVFDRTDLAVLVVPAGDWGEFEKSLFAEFKGRKTPVVVVFNKDDIAPPAAPLLDLLRAENVLFARTVAALGDGLNDLRDALGRLAKPPALVVTDSQAFLKVAADTPADVPMTSFSILFARFKGDLTEFVRGTLAIENLRPGSRVLVAEACSHHPITEDIGRVKIPRWLTQYVGGKLEFTTVQGHDFPDDPTGYDLIIHCGGCMSNRREILSRLLRCRAKGVPVTNYGMAIAYSLGIFERALRPFPAALELCRATKKRRG